MSSLSRKVHQVGHPRTCTLFLSIVGLTVIRPGYSVDRSTHLNRHLKTRKCSEPLDCRGFWHTNNNFLQTLVRDNTIVTFVARPFRAQSL
jgi:hypothetical protein